MRRQLSFAPRTAAFTGFTSPVLPFLPLFLLHSRTAAFTGFTSHFLPFLPFFYFIFGRQPLQVSLHRFYPFLVMVIGSVMVMMTAACIGQTSHFLQPTKRVAFSHTYNNVDIIYHKEL